MRETAKPLMDLTADDAMTREVVRLPEETPLREAAYLLLQNQIGGAPVVDREGRCVGVLSAVDFLRLSEKRARRHQAYFSAPPDDLFLPG